MSLHALRSVLQNESVTAGATSGLLGLAASTAGIIGEGYGAWAIGLSAVLGALLANLSKIITARANARMTEAAFVNQEIQGLVEKLKNDAWNLERILALENNLRHTIEGGYQAAMWQITYLETIMGEHNLPNVPKFQPLDVTALKKEFDREVITIRSTRPHAAKT